MTAQPKPTAAEVPTTERVREDYILGSAFSESDHLVWGQRFDRWLAEHDAQVAAEALRDAADHPGWDDDLVVPVWLRRRADRIAAGEEP